MIQHPNPRAAIENLWDRATPVEPLLDAYRDQVLTEAADHLDRIADQTEARVAEYYGPASGIGPGSADMVREAAKSVRELAARPAAVQGA